MTIQELKKEHQVFGIPDNIIKKIFDAIDTINKGIVPNARIELRYDEINTITMIWSSSNDSISIETSTQGSRILFSLSSKSGYRNGNDTDLSHLKSYLKELYQSKLF